MPWKDLRCHFVEIDVRKRLENLGKHSSSQNGDFTGYKQWYVLLVKIGLGRFGIPSTIRYHHLPDHLSSYIIIHLFYFRGWNTPLYFHQPIPMGIFGTSVATSGSRGFLACGLIIRVIFCAASGPSPNMSSVAFLSWATTWLRSRSEFFFWKKNYGSIMVMYQPLTLGVPPNHPFQWGVPWNKSSSYWGIPILGNFHMEIWKSIAWKKLRTSDDVGWLIFVLKGNSEAQSTTSDAANYRIVGCISHSCSYIVPLNPIKSQ